MWSLHLLESGRHHAHVAAVATPPLAICKLSHIISSLRCLAFSLGVTLLR